MWWAISGFLFPHRQVLATAPESWKWTWRRTPGRDCVARSRSHSAESPNALPPNSRPLLTFCSSSPTTSAGTTSPSTDPQIPALCVALACGVILDNYYVQPVCSPTRSSLLTGRHVIHSGIYDPDCNYKTTNAVPTQFTMLPKHLQRLGYETFAVGKWHLGYFAPDVLPTGRGFDKYFGYYGGAEDYFTHTAGFDEYIDIHDDNATIIRPAQGLSGHYSTHLYTDRAVSIIQRFAERHQHNDAASSLFLYLAYQAIHSPDEAPESYKWRFNKTIPDTPDGVGQHRRIVAGMVAALDEESAM